MSERKTTRFAVLEAERVVKVHEREIPALKADEVLIKNGACNICTTDYGQYTGARKNLMFPMAWGHEFAGTIVDMGSDVKEFEVGEMVGIGYDNCGECEFCKKGLTSECVTLGAGRNKLSPDGYHGGFGCSEYVIKPYRSLFKLNQNMDPSEAAFVEPVGTVCQGIRKLRVQQGEKIVVIGAGTMGVLNALVAKAEGCEVMITEMMDKKIPSETLRHASSVQIFQPCLLSFFLGWCGLIFHIQLMPHHSIQFFFQTLPDVLCIIIFLNKVIMQKVNKQIIGYLYILHFLSLPFRDGRDDGDGVLHTIKITVTTDTIVTLFPKQVSA